MKCGFGKICINPPVGISIAGSYDVCPSKGFLDDLHARSIAFSDGDKKALLVAVELCHMQSCEYDYARSEIAKRAKIDPDAIIITCTHTHAGPETYVKEETRKNHPEIAVMIDEYLEFLRESIVKCALMALDDLKESRFYSAKEKAEGIANVRRYLMKDGSTVTNPGAHNPNILRPLGKPNETVRLLKIVREGANDIYVINFGMHATTVHGRTYISADYPAVACSAVEGALGGVDCIFFQSAEGDVVQINTFPSPVIYKLMREDNDTLSVNKHMARFAGHAVAAAVLKMHMTAEEIGCEGIRFSRETVNVPSNKSGGDYEEAQRICALHKEERHYELPHNSPMDLVTKVANAQRIIRMKDEPDFYPYSVFCIAVGDFAFAGLPGEPFTEIRNRIDEASPFENTMVLALTNCKTQYFPTTKAFSEGGYEVAATSIGPGADDVIVSAAVRNLEKLK